MVIAHRVTTAMQADRVVLLDHSRVVQSGPLIELLAWDGAFCAWIRQDAQDLRPAGDRQGGQGLTIALEAP